jgi:transcriptional regulator with XRE-family HTH domain
MTLGDVLRKERERHRLTREAVAGLLAMPQEEYQQWESGEDQTFERWGPQIGEFAIRLKTPTSRLIAESGRSTDAAKVPGQCGHRIAQRREQMGLTQMELAKRTEMQVNDLQMIESGASPIEKYAPLLLRFAEVVEQPVFNLFYPCGLPHAELTDYP